MLFEKLSASYSDAKARRIAWTADGDWRPLDGPAERDRCPDRAARRDR